MIEISYEQNLRTEKLRRTFRSLHDAVQDLTPEGHDQSVADGLLRMALMRLERSIRTEGHPEWLS